MTSDLETLESNIKYLEANVVPKKRKWWLISFIVYCSLNLLSIISAALIEGAEIPRIVLGVTAGVMVVYNACVYFFSYRRKGTAWLIILLGLIFAGSQKCIKGVLSCEDGFELFGMLLMIGVTLFLAVCSFNLLRINKIYVLTAKFKRNRIPEEKYLRKTNKLLSPLFRGVNSRPIVEQ